MHYKKKSKALAVSAPMAPTAPGMPANIMPLLLIGGAALFFLMPKKGKRKAKKK